MSAIAVQGAVGGATTTLSYSFNSLCEINGFQFGVNSSGLFLLNTTEQDNEEDFTRSFTLATTDFGIKNPKRIRSIFIGIDAPSRFTVRLKPDDGDWQHYIIYPKKSGLQRIKKNVNSQKYGRYWTVKISSKAAFRIDEIKILPIVRSSGIIGY